MFNNLLKGNKGRTTTKILATLLVITLTFANFALLGTFMFESIAAEEKVKLDAYLELDNPSITEISKDINSEDLVLYVAIDVGGDGRLEKGSIDFSNSNFKSKENEQLQKNIEVISSGNKEIVKIPIVARKDSKFDLSLLNMSSQIKLTGEYIDKNGNSTKVDLPPKTVKVNWVTNEITQEEVEFSQEVITNKPYQINGQDKRVIQLLVKSNIKDNKVPVKLTKIEIENPIAGVTPEEVKVISYNTGATNGGTSVEFNKNQGSSWENKDNKTYIELKNEKDENNCVVWEKDATDELIVTYIYNKDTNVVPFSSKAKVLIEVYGNESKVEKENTLTLDTIEEKGKIIDIQQSASKNIYKGNMYLGQDTEYKTKYDVFVSYNLGGSIGINVDEDKTNSENVATYYKKTLINKEQAINLLSNNGRIEIKNGETEETISTIDLSKEHNEEYYTINYPDNVKKIVIVIPTATVKEGKLEIINEKLIKVLKVEAIESINKLDSSSMLVIYVDEGAMTDFAQTEGTISLLEPKTTIDVALDKQTISSQAENELTITTTLNANNINNKLFENPTIDIELPKEITEVTLGNISLVNEEELKIESSKTEIKTNESGNKVISIVLEGKQTKYNTSVLKGANIVMNLKVKTNPFMADKDVEIKTVCANKGETVDYTNNLKIVSKKGMLAKNSITIGENKVEEINNVVTSSITENSEIKINSVIINNNGQKVTNSVLTGSVPEGTDLKEQIHTNLNNATIYYSTKENPTSEEWTNQVEDYATVKSFKIEIGELEQASSFEIFYTLNSVEEELKEKEYVESNISINYVLGKQAKQENITFKVINLIRGSSGDANQKDNLVMTLKPKTETENFHEGQIVTYEVSVTNIGTETLKDVTLNYQIPEGAVYTEFDYSDASDDPENEEPIYYEDNEEIKNKEWAIETIASNQTIIKEVTIRINKGTKQIVSTANLKNSNGETLIEVLADPILVAEAKLSVVMISEFVGVEHKEGDTITYFIVIRNNSQEELKNLKVMSYVPENTKYNKDSEINKTWNYDEQRNTVSSTIDSIKPSEMKMVSFEVEVDKLSDNEVSAIIENIAIVKEGDTIYETNLYAAIVNASRWQIAQKTEHNTTLQEGNIVKYIIEAKNTGAKAEDVYIIDNIPSEIQIAKVTTYLNEQLINEEECFESNEIKESAYVNVGETLRVEIEGTILDLEDDIKTKEIKNKAKLVLEDGSFLETQEIVNIIENDTINETIPEDPGPENPEPEEPKPEEPKPEEPKPEEPKPEEPKPEEPKPEEPKPEEPKPEEPKPEEPAETYSISGLAWLDKNKNGIRDNNEEILQGIGVALLDKNGNIVKNSENKEIVTITTITGTYKFNNIPKGEYIVAFAYDTSKYSVSKYQVQDAAQENNSDVISKKLIINNIESLVGATDVITINDSDIQNIDMGLVENAKFDLSLEKYVSKVIVTNDQESTTYNFEEANLAKVEIAAKRLAKSSIIVQYEIKISNDGDIQGYVNDVIDYIPKELTFNSEMNPDWYSDSEGNLHNVSLEKTAIEPGKSQTVKLVLTKTLNNNSVGTIDNIAEIGGCTNLQGITEQDSISANKKAGEDDIGTASLIVSIKTGGPTLYIGIVILSLLILGAGIYLIDKKVLKGGSI